MKYRLFFLILVVVASFLTCDVNATWITIDNIIYDVAGDTAIVYSGKSCSGAVVIPESVTCNGENYRVTTIASSALSSCKGVTSVIISNSVKAIADSAFYNCVNLDSVVIGSSVRNIANSAFAYCAKQPVIAVPNQVSYIGGNSFRGCEGLTSFSIPKGVTKINYNAFLGCTNLATVDIPLGVTALIGNIIGAADITEGDCDINDDSEVNVSDVTALISMILAQ